MKDFVLGKSQVMQELMNRVQAVANSDIPVLLQGETGTGKNRLAEYIHYQSEQRNGLFLSIDCAALSRTLIESELFGHEKGAFTGATEKKAGLLELVCGGTLFLDEIENLDHELQAKILDVVETKEFRRVGGRESIKTDFRVISATNRDIQELIIAGRFRKDLYFRLKGLELNLLPLRKRREDIRHFIEYFLTIFEGRYGKKIALSRGAMDFLQEYHWPGNIRELGMVIESLVVSANDAKIGCEQLPNEIQQSGLLAKAEKQLWTAEDLLKAYVMRVIKATNHNKTEAAKILGWSINTLKNWLRKIDTED